MKRPTSKCKICGNNCEYFLTKKILGKYSIKYFKCKKCKFIQTEKPFWLKEAYSSAIIDSDTGILSRNSTLSKITALILIFLREKTSKVLDFAGGYGVMTRMLRDIGIDAYWIDKYAENIFAKSFMAKKKSYCVITAFEVFEHFENPNEEIKKIIDIYSPNTLIFSTMIHHGNPKVDWWYFAPEGGQHISLYSKESLKVIANSNNFHFSSNGRNIHIFSKKYFPSTLLYMISITWPLLSMILPVIYRSKTFFDRNTICKEKI